MYDGMTTLELKLKLISLKMLFNSKKVVSKHTSLWTDIECITNLLTKRG